MKRVTLIGLVALVGIAGCGESTSNDPEATARATGERFAAAIGEGDLRTVCRDLFSDAYKESLDAPALGTTCEDLQGPSALGSPALKGLFVGAVLVDGDQATVRFSDSSVYISLERDQGDSWRITSLEDGP